ncbi:3-beta hydroxysteroid dehydrogenase [Nocardioides deserti]|uniref:3-beta hydroxysteroid dehydrogenase n=1 Tax=Nocardioides deserti TaxID=1588644 RepID=A0ABR6U4T1_9ACTN|nr:3-beta hydroxysteroid dehydrogenase [Nocardioides deserti]GGO73391.1 3-beta hydroxysteroid dehydrogenase [Nocardioides deserti]
MRVAVAGGTGLVGSHVVGGLSKRGHVPVVLARARGVDLLTGTGLAEALEGVEAVIDVSNIVTTGRRASVGFFETATTNLLARARDAGVRHHVVLSIVGVDRVRFGYYEGKLRQERLALDGAVPATVLRATQFHEFAGQLLDRVPGPVAFLPRQLIRPVAAAEVAAELVTTALAEPRGLADELAGPEKHQLVDLARKVSARHGRRRPIIGVRLPGEGGRAMATGGLLPGTGARYGTQTFDEWLADERLGGVRA